MNMYVYQHVTLNLTILTSQVSAPQEFLTREVLGGIPLGFGIVVEDKNLTTLSCVYRSLLFLSDNSTHCTCSACE